MFGHDKGNHITTSTGKEGIIYDKISDDLYLVGLIETDAIRMTILKYNEIERKRCSYGASVRTFCDYTSDRPSESLYACKMCELKAALRDKDVTE